MSRINVLSKLVLAFFAASLLAVSASGQTNKAPAKKYVFELKNGDRLSGTVVIEDSKSIRITTRWNGELVLPKDEIIKRELVAPKPPPVPAAAVPPPAPATPVEKPKALAKTAASEPEPSAKPKPKGIWKFNLQLGADFRQSTVDSYLYTTIAKVTYARGEFNNAFDYRFSYGKTADKLSANRMDGTIKTDLNVGEEKRWFIYSLGGAGYDEVRKIDSQFELGPGVGRHLLIKDVMRLNAEGGFSFQQQSFSSRVVREDLRLRFAEDYFWRINTKISFDQKAEIQPALDDFADYRVRFEAGISYALWNNVTWNVNLLDLYDSKPAKGVSKNDLQIRSGIGVKF